MANNYSQHAANEVLIGCKETYDSLLDALKNGRTIEGEKEEDELYHGFSLDFYPVADDPNSGEVYLYAEETGNEGELPDEFLILFGELIKANSLPYLEIGFACTGSKMRVGAFGGGSYRINSQGKLIFQTITWEK